MRKKYSALLLSLLMLFTVFTPKLIEAAAQSQLKVHFINVHQGDSTLIQTPDKKIMLIDAGKNEEGQTVVNYLKANGIKKIDVLIGTHPDSDHIGGLDTVINNFNIGQLLMPNTSKSTATYKDVITAANAKKLKISRPVAGSYLSLGSKVKAQIVAPNSTSYEDANDYSIVIHLSYGKTSFLFTGDAEKTSELEMVRKGYNLRSTVLKVGHHGSSGSSSAQLLTAVKPQYAVISVGHNQYGHPTALTLAKLNKIGAKIYRTDQVGTIVMSSDGNTIKVDKKASAIKINAPPGTTTNTPQSNSSSTTVKKPTQPLKQSDSMDVTVYITNTGKKYHRAGCRYLKDSKIPVTLKYAHSQGLEPCSVCNPPR